MYAVRRWPKRCYTTHDCTLWNSLTIALNVLRLSQWYRGRYPCYAIRRRVCAQSDPDDASQCGVVICKRRNVLYDHFQRPRQTQFLPTAHCTKVVKCSGFLAQPSWNVMARAQKPDFVFRRNGRVHLNRRGASVHSITDSRGVRISGSNAGYTVFRGSVKSTGYTLCSPVSPFASPTVRQRVPSSFNWSLPLTGG
jgi:hypothetical protein